MEYRYMGDKIYVEFDFKLSTERLFRILMFFPFLFTYLAVRFFFSHLLLNV